MKRLSLLLGAIALLGVCLAGYWLIAGKSALAENSQSDTTKPPNATTVGVSVIMGRSSACACAGVARWSPVAGSKAFG